MRLSVHDIDHKIAQEQMQSNNDVQIKRIMIVLVCQCTSVFVQYALIYFLKSNNLEELFPCITHRYCEGIYYINIAAAGIYGIWTDDITL